MKTLLRSLVTFAFLATARPVPAAEVSINSLPAIGTVATSTVIPVVDVSGTPTTKKATVTQLINGLPVATGSTVGTMSAADKTKLDTATDANTASAIVRRDASGNFTAGTITATVVTGLATPTNGTDAANKSYVDASAAGLTVKQAGRAATTGTNITLSGGAPSTLDGLTLAGNDRILVKDQATGSQNGIYYVSTLGSGSNGTWTRTTDADVDPELATGTYIFISSGTVNANAAYTISTQGTITIGTTAIAWALFSQVTSVAASSITGQIIASQIQDAAINTAKFASGITPVEILGTLPVSGNFAGRLVFLTTTSKLYRYDGAAFVATTPTSDLTGTIAAGQIAANAITANEIASDAVTAGAIAAGAVNTSELAAGAVNASKIAANTITSTQIAANTILAGNIASAAITSAKISVSLLSDISANVGAVTSGTSAGWTLSSTKMSAASGASGIDLDAANVWVRATRGSSTATFGTRDPGTGEESYVDLNYGLNKNVNLKSSASGGTITVGDGSSGFSRATLNASGLTLKNSSNVTKFTVDSSTGTVSMVAGSFLNLASTAYINMASGSAITVGGGADVTFSTGSTLNIVESVATLSAGSTLDGPGDINLNAATGNPVNIVTSYSATAGTLQGYLVVKINSLTKLIPYYDPP